MKTTALVFSGQGSQYVGMAADIIAADDRARTMAQRANDILGYDLVEIMSHGPEDQLRQTRYTQPALFLHEAIVLATTPAQAGMRAVAGHSLGEYSALYAAGVVSFDDALELVQRRASLMFDAGDRLPGTMVAVVGMDDDAVRTLCAELNTGGDMVLVPANFNSPGQVVISGSAEYVRACMPLFKERGAKLVKELQVSGAFHSPLLAEAQAGLAESITATSFADASVPVYVNVSATPVTAAADLQAAAIAQLTAPVLWTDTMHAMWNDGISSFLEVGPGKVLQGLIKRTLSEATLDGIDTWADVQRYSEYA